MNIYITGMGCISPLGLNVDENHIQLQNEIDGIGKAEFLLSGYSQSKLFGEVKASNHEILQKLNVQNTKGLTRTDLLAFTAFNEAITDAQLSPLEMQSRETAFISASTVGGMCITDELYRDANLMTQETEFAHSYNCSAHTLRICKEYSIKGYTNTINTACSSSANAIALGMRLIQSGRAKRAIVGGVDSLAKFTVNGFNALQILSNSKCSPFDSERDGLNLGEASAYIVLESNESAMNKHKYAQIIGTGNTNDAFHTSSMSDNAIGVTSCMKQALSHANILPKQIDYINAHGTGTGNNDLVELTGFANIFEKIPAYSSTKSYTGHTLGAAGALEAIYSILAIYYGELYSSLRMNNLIPDFPSKPIKTFTPNVPVNYVMSNSYGFGGNCTSLIFSKS